MMGEKYTLQYRLYDTSENEGIYVFMANSTYSEGDIWLGVNCTTPLSWIVYTKRLDEFKNLIGDSKIVCAFISNRIREKNRDKISKLLKIHSLKEVKLMLEILDEFVKLTVTSNNEFSKGGRFDH